MFQQSFSFKVCLLGDQGVGKTSIRKVYMEEGFKNNYMKTIGVEISKKNIERGDIQAELVIWDMAGDVEFRNIRQSYMSGISGAVLVIDSTTEINIQTLIWWLEDINKVPHEYPIPVALVANKIDLVDLRKVTETNLEGVAYLLKETLGDSPLEYFETSALNGQGINDVFSWLVNEMIEIHSGNDH